MKWLHLVVIILASTGGILAAADPETSVDTFNGQSIGPGLSSDDANSYVNSLVKKWLDSKGEGYPKIDQREVGPMASTVKSLGMANLLACYNQTKGDILYVVNATRDPADEVKRSVLETAMSRTATASDLDAILKTYDAHPLILEVLVDHVDWDSDARVSDFLVAQLDLIPEAYKKSDMAPGYLLTLMARNPSPAVQSKWDSFLNDLTTNDAHYPNGHVYVDLIRTYAQSGNPVIAKHLPDIFTVLGNRIKPTVSDPYTDISTQTLFVQLNAALRVGLAWKNNSSAAATALFSDEKSREVVLKLAKDSEDSNYNGVTELDVLVPAAACGDKASLKKVADASTQSGGASFLAKSYMTTVVYKGPGDNKSQAVTHIDEAVYDPATAIWTITAAN